MHRTLPTPNMTLAMRTAVVRSLPRLCSGMRQQVANFIAAAARQRVCEAQLSPPQSHPRSMMALHEQTETLLADDPDGSLLLHQLPGEILELIFAHLTLPDLARASQVCRAFASVRWTTVRSNGLAFSEGDVLRTVVGRSGCANSRPPIVSRLLCSKCCACLVSVTCLLCSLPSALP